MITTDVSLGFTLPMLDFTLNRPKSEWKRFCHRGINQSCCNEMAIASMWLWKWSSRQFKRAAFCMMLPGKLARWYGYYVLSQSAFCEKIANCFKISNYSIIQNWWVISLITCVILPSSFSGIFISEVAYSCFCSHAITQYKCTEVLGSI